MEKSFYNNNVKKLYYKKTNENKYLNLLLKSLKRKKN